MTVAKRINLLVIAGVVIAGVTATAVSVNSLRRAGDREVSRVRDRLAGKQRTAQAETPHLHGMAAAPAGQGSAGGGQGL